MCESVDHQTMHIDVQLCALFHLYSRLHARCNRCHR